VASENRAARAFAIDNVPALTGSGQLQVVVTDVLGRQQVLSQPYYSGTALLRPGLAEYSLEVGSLRENYGVDSFAYGDLVGSATYRRGITNTLTAGTRVEAQGNGTFAAGADSAWQAGTLGIVTAHVAAGGDGSQSGFLGGIGLEHNGRYVSALRRRNTRHVNFSSWAPVRSSARRGSGRSPASGSTSPVTATCNWHSACRASTTQRASRRSASTTP